MRYEVTDTQGKFLYFLIAESYAGAQKWVGHGKFVIKESLEDNERRKEAWVQKTLELNRMMNPWSNSEPMNG